MSLNRKLKFIESTAWSLMIFDAIRYMRSLARNSRLQHIDDPAEAASTASRTGVGTKAKNESRPTRS